MTTKYPFNIPVPCHVKEQRELLITNDYCPECGGSLDTGYECNDCGFDAISELPQE